MRCGTLPNTDHVNQGLYCEPGITETHDISLANRHGLIMSGFISHLVMILSSAIPQVTVMLGSHDKITVQVFGPILPF